MDITFYNKRCLKGVLVVFGFCVCPLLSESSLLPESVAIAGINTVCINLHLADISQNFGEA